MDRRKFIRKSLAAALGGVSVYSAPGTMRLVQAAARQSQFTDYKALVCVFMLGGNDSFNTIVPINGGARAIYDNARQSLAIPTSQLLPLIPVPGGAAPSDGSNYGLYSATTPGDPVGISRLQALFNGGKAAVVCNVGTLIRPTTKADIATPGFPLPGELGAHSGQQNFWQTSRPDNASGWAGRMADLLYTGNANQALPMNISLSSDAVFLQGANVTPYAMGTNGAVALEQIGASDARRRAAFLQLMQNGTTRANVFERAYANVMQRTVANYQAISGAFAASPPLNTIFPNTLTADALKTIARTIAVRSQPNVGRQIFFVSQWGFDFHDNQLYDHPRELCSVLQALTAFYDATVELGVANNVTTFTASDFGRSTSSNGDGTDHGWGGHHFVVGGAVRGGSCYGQMPNISVGGPDDGYYGAVIPKISVDQYGATLAKWFGVSPANLNDVFPSLANFATADLGFMG